MRTLRFCGPWKFDLIMGIDRASSHPVARSRWALHVAMAFSSVLVWVKEPRMVMRGEGVLAPSKLFEAPQRAPLFSPYPDADCTSAS